MGSTLRQDGPIFLPFFDKIIIMSPILRGIRKELEVELEAEWELINREDK